MKKKRSKEYLGGDRGIKERVRERVCVCVCVVFMFVKNVSWYSCMQIVSVGGKGGVRMDNLR